MSTKKTTKSAKPVARKRTAKTAPARPRRSTAAALLAEAPAPEMGPELTNEDTEWNQDEWSAELGGNSE